MVDEILSQEDQEIEELVSWMQHAEGHKNEEPAQHPISDYGSDDEEYDKLFMDVVTKASGQKESNAGTDLGQALEMDLSLD